jgi:hypothetical protein
MTLDALLAIAEAQIAANPRLLNMFTTTPFPDTIERHPFNDGPRPCSTYLFDDIRIGSGRTILAMVTGVDFPPEDPRHGSTDGYPCPSIAEANAFADEIIRRWNAHEALVTRVTELEATVDAVARAVARPAERIFSSVRHNYHDE